jgi:phosphoribosylglycinamide formyltransferase-1
VSEDVSAPAGARPRPLVPLPARLAVLLSGRGSNFDALYEACQRGNLPATIALVVSDVPGAPGLGRAEMRGLPVAALVPGEMGGKAAFEEEVQRRLVEARVDLVCLAGFMRILSPAFVARWPLRILNVHPSLLPAFPGLSAQEQAIRYGARVSGATVHFVDAGTDTGPIVGQTALPLRENEAADSYAARLLSVEHALYVSSLGRVLEGGWRLDGRAIRFPDRRAP